MFKYPLYFKVQVFYILLGSSILCTPKVQVLYTSRFNNSIYSKVQASYNVPQGSSILYTQRFYYLVYSQGSSILYTPRINDSIYSKV